MSECHRFLEGLRAPDPWTRQSAISKLISYPMQEYREFLEEGVRNHEDAAIRNGAMEVFRALGTRAIPSLALLAEDPDPEVRLFTSNILSEIKDNASAGILRRLTEDADVNVRAASAEALGKIRDSDSLPLLKKMLSDEAWVGMAAIMAIGDIGGEEALQILYKCLERDDLRQIAISAIGEAGDKEAIRRLTFCFEREDLRGEALKAMVKIAERERVRPHPEYLVGLIPVLIEMLDMPDTEWRGRAFLALCWAEDVAALPYIIEGIKDEEIQEYAIEGLLRIGRRAVCSIVDELKGSAGRHRVILAKVLGMIGEGKALLQFAEDEDPEVRAEVALSLGSLDLARAATTLSKMRSDPCEEVRLAAVKSLASLRGDGVIP